MQFPRAMGMGSGLKSPSVPNRLLSFTLGSVDRNIAFASPAPIVGATTVVARLACTDVVRRTLDRRSGALGTCSAEAHATKETRRADRMWTAEIIDEKLRSLPRV